MVRGGGKRKKEKERKAFVEEKKKGKCCDRRRRAVVMSVTGLMPSMGLLGPRTTGTKNKRGKKERKDEQPAIASPLPRKEQEKKKKKRKEKKREKMHALSSAAAISLVPEGKRRGKKKEEGGVVMASSSSRIDLSGPSSVGGRKKKNGEGKRGEGCRTPFISRQRRIREEKKRTFGRREKRRAFRIVGLTLWFVYRCRLVARPKGKKGERHS